MIFNDIAMSVKSLGELPVLDDATKRGIHHAHALKLFPCLASPGEPTPSPENAGGASWAG